MSLRVMSQGLLIPPHTHPNPSAAAAKPIGLMGDELHDVESPSKKCLRLKPLGQRDSPDQL